MYNLLRKKKIFFCVLLIIIFSNLTFSQNCSKYACTSFAAGRLSTIDGSTMSGHTCEGPCDFTLTVVPASKHQQGETISIDYEGLAGGIKHKAIGKTEIPQVPFTYAYFQTECPIGNEYQVFFGENTCRTKREMRNLSDDEALLDYTQVQALALQRGKTARQAIRIAGELIEKYGFNGMGESFLVTDPCEAWCFEIPGFTNVWAAQRIPDEHVCPHANRMRIGELNLKDTDNFMAAPNLIQLAIDKKFYNPKKDGAFNFSKVYCGNKSWGNRIREWRMLSLLCPSRQWDPNAEYFPFSVKPDEKISAQWWIENVWRDHLEGTDFDKTKGIAAGPFGCPEIVNIRGVRTQRSICNKGISYSWVSQARSSLPNPVGGVIWFGLDSPCSCCYVPFYAGIEQTPQSWQGGDFTKFSDKCPRWLFQAIDTLSMLKYSQIHKDVREVFDAIESEQFEQQAKIEKIASELYRTDPNLCIDFLSRYCNDRAIEAESAARELFYHLIVKYSNGGPRASVSPEWLELLNENKN